MAIWVGTSGYNYPEWKGSFYPQKLPTAQMLPYYAERFSTVEINYSFYRMPTEKILAGWSRETPANFKLTLKAPKRITHDARLRDCAQALNHFCRSPIHWARSSARCCSSCRPTSERTSVCWMHSWRSCRPMFAPL